MSVYIPTKEELYTMQELGANVYKYIIAKTIETIIMGKINKDDGKILSTEYKYIRENPDIAHSICYLYPKEIKYSQIAQYDIDLCLKLINKEYNRSIYKLDDLLMFSDSTLDNLQVISAVIKQLKYGLIDCPQYRFEYQKTSLDEHGNQRQNKLLEDIFNCQITSDQIIDSETLLNLSCIEPTYIIKFKKSSFLEKENIEYVMKKTINEYAKRYDINEALAYEYIGKDILSKPDDNIKKLLKRINKKR